MNKNRQLTLQEHQRAVRLYNEMARVFTAKEVTFGPRMILARNRFVEIAITECLEYAGDEAVMLEAWRLWVEGRDLEHLTWPVTKFQQEMEALLDTAKLEAKCKLEQARWEASRRVGGR
jgi:hypothetical protein